VSHAARIAALLAEAPIVLAPMEDVTDAVFRRICRQLGAIVCVTEFVRAEQAIARARIARRKMLLTADDTPTAIQIYGADADLLMQAAEVAAAARPAFVDINCGCWVPRVVRGGAGASWLRDPAKMVEMARRVVAAVDLPVTVKTRIGWGAEAQMPIVDLARRLEDVGVAGLTVHCRTAQMGHTGDADWQWARRAREVVSMPVVVNGDVRTADDARRALDETGCAGAMIGRAAIENPWVLGEAHALVTRGERRPAPTDDQRIALYREILLANVAQRGDVGVMVTRRHIPLLGPTLRLTLRTPLCKATTVAEALDILDGAAAGRSVAA
jgi:tRNA-dihydrouridine synthase B